MEIAIIAHDDKKAEMVSFLMKHLDVLNNKDVTLVSISHPPFLYQQSLKTFDFTVN